MNISSKCKICGAKSLNILAHTAKCNQCGVLLCYPYPDPLEKGYLKSSQNLSEVDRKKISEKTLGWHLKSGARNHHNFTNMTLFALDDNDRNRELKVLDYGGGGGQFALVLKSLFPKTEIFIVDMNNEKLLNIFKPLNKQIKFEDFLENEEKFDVIFMNDVFEHVSDPSTVLKVLKNKLNKDGKIFIDTPCQFWLYPVTRILSKKIHIKILNGTVDYDHQQIWTKKSFQSVINEAGFTIIKYMRLSEYTQNADFYMKNMKIESLIIKIVGKIFFSIAPFIAKNKIMAVISKK